MPTEIGGRGGFEYLNDLFGAGISAGRYRGYLDIGADNVREIFACFASPDVFPSVVHCTAGKDRTGVITALVLDLVGVDHETIVADYALSNAAVPDLLRHFSGEERVVGELGELHPEVLEAFKLRHPAALFEIDLTTLTGER